MEPVKGGSLAVLDDKLSSMFKNIAPDASISSNAIRFAASHDGVAMVLSGMSNLSQVEDNIKTFSPFIPMDEKEKMNALKVGELIRNMPGVGCTGCKYCVEGCAANINIPEIIKVYNKYLRERSLSSGKSKYRKAVENGGSAKDCIGCGACESACPQKIEIIKVLSDSAKYFE